MVGGETSPPPAPATAEEAVPSWVRGLYDPRTVDGGRGRLRRFRCPASPLHDFADDPSAVARRGREDACPKCVLARSSVATLWPSVAEEWSPLNASHVPPPTEVAADAPASVWFRCAAGHDWRAVVRARCCEDDPGCPECTGVVASEDSALTARVPGIARLWDVAANGDLYPGAVLATSEAPVALFDPLTGFKWTASPKELAQVAEEDGETAAEEDERDYFGSAAVDAILERYVPAELRARARGLMEQALAAFFDRVLAEELLGEAVKIAADPKRRPSVQKAPTARRLSARDAVFGRKASLGRSQAASRRLLDRQDPGPRPDEEQPAAPARDEPPRPEEPPKPPPTEAATKTKSSACLVS